MRNTSLEQSIHLLKNWAIGVYEHLHSHPELSGEEHLTSSYGRQIFETLGYQITLRFGEGFTADLNVDPGAPMVALRADMDALPIQEQTGHPHSSQQCGKAHACGHDLHMCVALTAAKWLSENRDQLRVNVRFVFQPSEEKVPGGALGMIQAGSLEGVTEIFGLHNEPLYPVGKVGVRTGAISASGDLFTIKIIGKGCHSARPQEGLSPIPVAAQLIQSIQKLSEAAATRQMGSILCLTQVHAGEVINAVPATATLTGTLRSFRSQDREEIQKKIEEAVTLLVSHPFQASVQFQKGYDSVENHSESADRVAGAVQKALGETHLIENCPPVTWSEDFCYYLNSVKGAFFLLGSRSNEPASHFPLHSPHYLPSTDAIFAGAAVLVQLVLDYEHS